jgi:hypothetical protein
MTDIGRRAARGITAGKRARRAGMTLPLMALLAGCFDSGEPGIVTTTVQTAQGPVTVAYRDDGQTTPADYAAALKMWRETRVKDSCAACHGADFFDLARIGTSDGEIVRRAVMDGASQDEADALVKGVKFVRTQFRLQPENPRTFRLLQPGGAVLPGASPIERDLAFADEVARAMPVLASATPITTLAQAKQARDEFLAIDFKSMRIGIPFPTWSSDIFNGNADGTLNDWVADLPRVPIPERKAEWFALQDAYLADPSDLNFWKMYFAVDTMTKRFGGLTPYDGTDGWKADRFTAMKFKSALIGQHLMRTEAMGRSGFMKGQVAFAHLASEEPFKTAFRGQKVHANGEKLPVYLPNPMWEVGDVARFGFRPTDMSAGVLGNRGGADLMRDRMRLLGYPQFVLDSIDPTARAELMLNDTQLAWFMLGVVFDPGLQRVAQSGSTLVGEYLQAQLSFQDYFIHRTFQNGLRMVVRTYRPEGKGDDFVPYRLHFGYFTGYGRHTPTKWNSEGEAGVPATVKAQQIAAYKRITANFFRMSLLLHEEELNTGRIRPYGNIGQDGDYAGINSFFAYAGLPGRDADTALIRRVAAKSGTTLNF